MEFKDILKVRMDDLNIDAESLSKYVGVSPSTISRYLSGEITNIRRDKLKKLSDALLIDVSYLMGWEEYLGNPISQTNQRVSNSIPVYSNINCRSLFDQSNIISNIEIPSKIAHKKNLFGLKIKDNSMNVVFPMNSIAVFQKCEELKQGDIAAVIVGDNETVVRHFYPLRDAIVLEPDSYNTDCESKIYSGKKGEEYEVIGKFIWFCMDPD